MGTRFCLWILAVLLVGLFASGDRCVAGHALGESDRFAGGGPGALQPETRLLATRENRTNSPETGGDLENTLYRAVLRVIRDQYVAEIADERIFKEPVQKLLMALPPLCAEDVASPSECSREAEACLLDAVNAIAVHCHLKKERVFKTAVDFILRDLDPNSCLLDETMLKELTITTSGKFGGVGMMVAPRNGDYVVMSPFEGSPAYQAGIRAGDIMLEIDGRPIHDMPLIEVLAKVRGPVGSAMDVTVKNGRTGEIRHARLRRKTIVIPPVRSVMFPERVAYLRIVNFQSSTRSEVEKALQKLFARGRENLKGLILDLRDNPGGLLDQAIEVANLFISDGTITSLRGRNKRLNREFTGNHKAVADGIPVVVLINRGTASSAEILAGALLGKPHVVVMGERSFGKASVQAVYPLSAGTALRLTTAHYYTAQGRDIEGKGLAPDVPMDEPAEHRDQERMEQIDPRQLHADPWIQRSLEILLSGKSTESAGFQSLY